LNRFILLHWSALDGAQSQVYKRPQAQQETRMNAPLRTDRDYEELSSRLLDVLNS